MLPRTAGGTGQNYITTGSIAVARLTKRILESAENKAKDYFIFDDELPGFGLRVMPSGRRIFVLQYRVGCRARRYTLGHFPVLTVEQARAKATKVLAAVRDGQDPSGEKRMLAQAPTVRDLGKRYLEEHCAMHVKPSTLRGYSYVLDRYILPEIGHLKVVDVTRAHIANMHSAMSKKPINANRMLEIVSKMFNLAELWGWRNEGTNPRRHIKKFKENKRERYLSPVETKRLGQTLCMAEEAHLCSAYAIAAFRLLILTGARLGEIQFCKWEYVDLNSGIIRLPDSKTGAKFIHLGRTAVELLRHLPRKDGNPYLICSDHHADKPINDLQTTWRKIRKWAEIEDVRIHDLRHTFASNAVAMGMSLPMIGKLLGHSQTQTTARYAHLAISPVLEAATKVADELGCLLSLPKPDDGIVIDGTAVCVDPPSALPLAEKLHVVRTDGLPRFMTPAQAANHLNINPRLLENWRWRKKGPKYVKVGNNVRYTLEELDRFAAV